MFRTLVGDHGAAELETVRRFRNPWEAAASLRLRERDVSVLALYAEHDRIGAGSRQTAMEDAFAASRDARARGCSVLVMAGDNATAEAFALRARGERVASGEVEASGVQLVNGVAGIGDEIVTLKNDRRLVPSPGEFVRNGERWRVAGRQDDGSLAVEAMSGRGRVELPLAYVREHVALAYALTVHKAQGQTVDVGIALVDERMTSQQLYVAMSRGRDENRAFVIQSRGELSEHAFANFTNPTAHEVLAEVLQRDGAERSAHDVLRQSLEKMDDLGLLRHLHAEANRHIDEKAGHDRTKEIERLAAKADLVAAQAKLEVAYGLLREVTDRRENAEWQIEEPTARDVRAADRVNADLRGARVAEQRALRDAERARHVLYEAEQATDEIARLRGEQHRRIEWLHDHSDEARYVVQLESRIAAVDGAVGRGEDGQDRGRERPADLGRRTADQAVVDRSPRHRLEHKLAAEEERINSRQWHSVAELDRLARQIEKELASTISQLDRNSVRVDDVARADEAASDHRAIERARDEAARHLSAAATRRDQGERLIEQAQADYLVARDASAVIEQGPGRLRFRSGAVSDAKASLHEIEERWPGRRLPTSFWGDELIRDAAEKAARTSVEPEVRDHLAAANQREREARRIEQAVAQRERIYDGKERRAIASVAERVDAHNRAESAREELAKDWRQRGELAADMTPDEVAEADRSRDAWLKQRTAERHESLVRDQVRGIEHAAVPHLEHKGPEIYFGR